MISISDRLLTEIERQKKYLDKLPADFEFPLFNAKVALESQRRNGYRNTAAAARELVDNAIEAGATNVDVTFERVRSGPERELVTAVAAIDNGSGMLPNMARYALSWGGGTHFEDPSFIGRFGFGLPNASINQSLRVEVYTRTSETEPIARAWLDASGIPTHGIQAIPAPELGAELPDFVLAYMRRRGLKFKHGTVVVWVRPDRLSYKTAANLKEHLLDDFGTTYRYLLRNVDLRVEGVQVQPVDPLFLDPNARFYRAPDQGGAILKADQAIPLKLYMNEDTGEMHLKQLEDAQEIESLKQGSKDDDGQVLAVGVIQLRVTNFPLGLVVGKRGLADIRAVDEDSRKRFEIRQSRRGISFVRAGREIEVVDAFPRSSREMNSGLGDWPTLESYAYHWGVEIKFGPELDDVFGITNDKQRVRPIEDFWRVMAQMDIDALLRKVDNEQRKWRADARKAAEVPQASAEPSPAEVAATVVDKVAGQPPQVPEQDLEKIKDKFLKAVKERSSLRGESLEEAAKAIEAQAKRRPYKVDYFEDAQGPFYVPEWGEGLQIVVLINRKHPFYEACYTASMGKQAREALNLFLLALARAELTAKEVETRQWYEFQRAEVWSKFLAISMRNLASRFEGLEEEELATTA